MAGLGEAGVVTVAGSLEFCGWDIAAGLEQVSVVETVDVFKGRDLNLLDGAPWPQLALAALVVEVFRALSDRRFAYRRRITSTAAPQDTGRRSRRCSGCPSAPGWDRSARTWARAAAAKSGP